MYALHVREERREDIGEKIRNIKRDDSLPPSINDRSVSNSNN